MTKKDFQEFTPNEEVEQYANYLKSEFELSDFEALKIAIESQRNEILYRAFGLSNYKDADHPPFLEGIGIALGYNEKK